MMRSSPDTGPSRSARSERSGRSTKPHVNLHQVVASVRDGDGVDPREEARRQLKAAKARRPSLDRGTHRQERFAAQVQEALESALQLAADPDLNALTVQEVVHQGGSFLVVTGPREDSAPLDVASATLALREAAPMLTREVARAITRKEAPNLTYAVLPAGARRIET